MTYPALIDAYNAALKKIDASTLCPDDFEGSTDLDIIEGMADTLLQANPAHALALKFKGTISLHDENYAEAIPYLRQALKRRPKDKALSQNLAQAYYRAGHYAESIPLLLRTAENPEEIFTHAMLAYAYFKAGRSESAKPHFKIAIQALEDLDRHYTEIQEMILSGFSLSAPEKPAPL